ncbi:unnamed protein product [Sympodiomycopsis kandeliae]
MSTTPCLMAGGKKPKSSSSKRYLARQSSDPYVQSLTSPTKAKSLKLPTGPSVTEANFISRSAYKLYELNESHRFLTDLNNNKIILDLGASPGGWIQMIDHILEKRKQMKTSIKSSKVIALDLLPLHPSVTHSISGKKDGASFDFDFIQGDFTCPTTRQVLSEKIIQWRKSQQRQADPNLTVVSDSTAKVNIILSDMMSNTTDSITRNSALSHDLLLNLYTFALDHLSQQSSSFLILKVFQSAQADAFRSKYLQGPTGAFQKVKTEKVQSSRKESREVYWVCKGFKGGMHVQQEDM